MYTEQIYTNPAKFTPGDLGYGYVYCFHLFPGAEVDDFAMMSLVPLNSNPENLHSTFYFTLPDVSPQPKPSTA